MGSHMARNLTSAGLLTAVWNRTADKARQLATELSVAAPATLAELASQVDAVVSCVSADADVLEVVRGLSPGLKSGALMLRLLDHWRRDRARRRHSCLEQQGVEFLDCPVSGGVEGARDGTLAIMVRRDQRGVSARLAGPDGAWAAPSPISARPAAARPPRPPTRSCAPASSTRSREAMAFAHAQGLPLDKLVDTLGKGAGSSWYFVHRAPNMVRATAIRAGFRVRLHAKDLGICHDMAARFGVRAAGGRAHAEGVRRADRPRLRR